MKTLLALLLLAASSFSWAHTSIVYNLTDDKVEYNEEMDRERSMASLTKLMTALLIVDSPLDLDETVKYRGGVFATRKVSRMELLESLLIRSDNAAAEALARSWPGGRDAFIQEMNARARQLNMLNTTYRDPSGLDNRNASTARDLVKIIAACGKHPLIRHVSSTKYLTLERKYKKRIKIVEISNTNKLLFEFDEIILSKTGTTTAAGRCLALMVDKGGKQYAIVILGEKTIRDREQKARQLIFNYATMDEIVKDSNENRFHSFNF